MEQIDQLVGNTGVVGQALLDIGLIESQPGLAQIAAECTQQRNFAPLQPGQHHQPVETVVFDIAAEYARECLLEIVAADIGFEVVVGAQLQAEIADPDGVAVDGIDAVRVLIEHFHAHVFQHRQAVRQTDRLVAPQQLEMYPVMARHVVIQVHGDVAVELQAFNLFDIVDRAACLVILAICQRKGVAILAQQSSTMLFAEMF